jgi:hypothetical protein
VVGATRGRGRLGRLGRLGEHVVGRGSGLIAALLVESAGGVHEHRLPAPGQVALARRPGQGPAGHQAVLGEGQPRERPFAVAAIVVGRPHLAADHADPAGAPVGAGQVDLDRVMAHARELQVVGGGERRSVGADPQAEGRGHQRPQVLELDRLLQDGDPGVARDLRPERAQVGRHEDHVGALTASTELAQDLEAEAIGQVEVADHQLGRGVVEEHRGLGHRAGGQDVDARELGQPARGLDPQHGLVLDQEDRPHGALGGRR